MRTFGTLALFCIVSFLGALMLVDAEEPEIIADKSRDALVVSLCADVRMLIGKREIPETDRATAYDIRASLISDMPLKTIEEMKKGNSKVRGQAWIIDEMYKRELKKSIEEAFSRSHKANSPPLTVTPSLAHDLYRLTLLRGVFRRAQIRSKALDVLFDRVIMKIEMTTSA